MRQRTKIIDKGIIKIILVQSVEPQNNFPGPGNYEQPEATNPKGTYYITKFQNSGARYFNPKSS